MISKITGGETKLIFTSKVLGKYDVSYFKCSETGFIQTEEPYWLEEAYSSAITKLDVGLVYRNEFLRDELIKIIPKHFNEDAKFLDYAGGYGLFTRLMRDKGFDFYHTDIYCQNLFAEYFDLKDIKEDTRFELITAFEVFEHMNNPIEEIKQILCYSDTLLFSTELQPQTPLESVLDWWYFIPETGQHVSFHTQRSLEYLAAELKFNFYTNCAGIHLFTKKRFNVNPLLKEREPFLIRKMRKFLNNFDQKNTPGRPALLQKDWKSVKDKIS